jgi:hypothetical protein
VIDVAHSSLLSLRFVKKIISNPAHYIKVCTVLYIIPKFGKFLRKESRVEQHDRHEIMSIKLVTRKQP